MDILYILFQLKLELQSYSHERVFVYIKINHLKIYTIMQWSNPNSQPFILQMFSLSMICKLSFFASFFNVTSFLYRVFKMLML